MKQYLSSFNTFVAFLSIVTLLASCSGCLNDDNLIGENCYDGILNNGEELIDCGGTICDPCDPCENDLWDALLGEQWVDCGGECGPCDPSFNGQLDPGELGIDCGCDGCPACPELCGDGLPNGFEEGIDCGGPNCDPCPTCTDGEMNGSEIGVDCGGTECDPCPTTGDCTNGLQDGDELYIDCGGSSCPVCEGAISWKANGQQFMGDASATATMNGTSIAIAGVSLTTAQIGFVMAEPAIGWENGVVIPMNLSTAPGTAGAYESVGGVVTYSTSNGGNITMELTYVVSGAGGYVTGSFSGNMQSAVGAGVTISQGTFAIPIN
jgi:hypothetical protein